MTTLRVDRQYGATTTIDGTLKSRKLLGTILPGATLTVAGNTII